MRTLSVTLSLPLLCIPLSYCNCSSKDGGLQIAEFCVEELQIFIFLSFFFSFLPFFFYSCPQWLVKRKKTSRAGVFFMTPPLKKKTSQFAQNWHFYSQTDSCGSPAGILLIHMTIPGFDGGKRWKNNLLTWCHPGVQTVRWGASQACFGMLKVAKRWKTMCFVSIVLFHNVTTATGKSCQCTCVWYCCSAILAKIRLSFLTWQQIHWNGD